MRPRRPESQASAAATPSRLASCTSALPYADGTFDVDRFRAAARIFLTAQEILVDNAGYPSHSIARNSHAYRPLGLEAGGVDEHGVRRPGGGSGLRNALSRFYYKDTIAPVTPAELAAAHHHGEHEALDTPEAAAGIEQHSESVASLLDI